jgi:hypothetical protein
MQPYTHFSPALTVFKKKGLLKALSLCCFLVMLTKKMIHSERDIDPAEFFG